eukprot:2558530-Prorocentrum_lima.AAC.1
MHAHHLNLVRGWKWARCDPRGLTCIHYPSSNVTQPPPSTETWALQLDDPRMARLGRAQEHIPCSVQQKLPCCVHT